VNNYYDPNGQQQQQPKPPQQPYQYPQQNQQQQPPYQQPYYYQHPYPPQQPAKSKNMSTSTFLTIIILLGALILILNPLAKKAGFGLFGATDDDKGTTERQELKLKASGIEETDHIGLAFAEDGKVLLVINYSIENKSDSDVDFSNRYFTLMTPTGLVLEAASYKINDIQGIKPGGTLNEKVVFEIPEDMRGKFTLTFDSHDRGHKDETIITRK